MKIRLQEIELGATDPGKSKSFYSSLLGLETAMDQEGLKVFHTGISGMDFNISTHVAPGTTVTSFLTDDLQYLMDRLSANEIVFTGPKNSHLGMVSIEFNDPDGYLVRVNQPTEDSPPWIQV